MQSVECAAGNMDLDTTLGGKGAGEEGARGEIVKDAPPPPPSLPARLERYNPSPFSLAALSLSQPHCLPGQAWLVGLTGSNITTALSQLGCEFYQM